MKIQNINIITGRTDNLYVSGFHTVLSVASYYAQVIQANTIVIGATKEQFDSIKTLKESFEVFAKHIELMNPEAGEFRIQTPLANLTKSEIVKLSKELNVPIEMSWSCLRGGNHHCGECEQCNLRRKAFQESGVEDKTAYLVE